MTPTPETAVLQATQALSIERVTCAFSRSGSRNAGYTAIADTTVHVMRGEFVSIVGPTGCGKSTLLNVAAGLVQPTSGDVALFGARLQGLNRAAGYMFQTEALMPWMNALDNVAVGLVYRGTPWSAAREAARDWLRRVGLPSHAALFPYQLSGGMRKRLALAQTLILDPKILLMDEPFSALDIQTRHLMENELLELWSLDRKSALFITHDLEEAISLSDRVIVLSAGPASRPIGEFAIDLPRPRDVAEIRLSPQFVELHREIWAALKDEVLRAYRQATT
jgi:NitT/TauT family transport system ATP-binding protein